jgi:hypothetical protein
MAMSLMTEKFIKRLIIAGLKKVVKMTETDEDNKLLEAALATWEKEDEKTK